MSKLKSCKIIIDKKQEMEQLENAFKYAYSSHRKMQVFIPYLLFTQQLI